MREEKGFLTDSALRVGFGDEEEFIESRTGEKGLAVEKFSSVALVCFGAEIMMMRGPSIWLFRDSFPFDRPRLKSSPITAVYTHFAASWVDKCPQGKGQHSG